MSVVRSRYVDAAGEPEVRPRRRRTATVARGAHRAILILAVVGSLHALFLLGVEAWRFVIEREAVGSLQGQVVDLRDQARSFQQVIDHAGDPAYREDLARRQGYMYPNEQRAVTQEPPAAPSH